MIPPQNELIQVFLEKQAKGGGSRKVVVVGESDSQRMNKFTLNKHCA